MLLKPSRLALCVRLHCVLQLRRLRLQLIRCLICWHHPLILFALGLWLCVASTAKACPLIRVWFSSFFTSGSWGTLWWSNFLWQLLHCNLLLLQRKNFSAFEKKDIYISIFNFHHVSKIRQLRKSFHEWSGHTATVCCAQQLLAACTVLNVVPLTLYLWRQIDFASVYYPLNLCCVTCQFSCGDYCFEWLQVTYLLSKLHLIVRKIIFLIADFDAKYYLGADI